MLSVHCVEEERVNVFGNVLVFTGLALIALAEFRPRIIWHRKGMQKIVGRFGYYPTRTMLVLTSFVAIGFGIFLGQR